MAAEFACSAEYIVLRACERLRVSPLEAVLAPPHVLAAWIAYDRVREAMERQAGGGGSGGGE